MDHILKSLPGHIDQDDLLNALEITTYGGCSDDRVETLVAAALGKIGQLLPSAERTLLDLLLKSNASYYAAESLVNANLASKHPHDFQRIEKWLAEDDEWKRVHAVALLGTEVSVEDKHRTIGLLRTALHDSSEKVRQVAVDAVGRIGKPGYQLLVEIIRDRAELEEDLRELFCSIHPVRTLDISLCMKLVDIYPECDSGGKTLILQCLREAPPMPEIVAPIVFSAVRDANDEVRSESMSPLGNYGVLASPMLDQLIDAFEHERERLARINERDFTDDDIYSSPLDDIIDVFGEIGAEAAPALPYLMPLLDDPQNYFFDYALEAVCNIGPGEAEILRFIEVMETLFEQNHENNLPWPVLCAIRSVNSIAREQVMKHLVLRFIEILKSAEDTRIVGLAWCMEEIGTLATVAIPTLIEALEGINSEGKAYIISALGEIGERDLSFPVLQKTLDSENTDLHEAAVLALSGHEELPDAVLAAMETGLVEWTGKIRVAAASALYVNDRGLNAKEKCELVRIMISPLKRNDFQLSLFAEEKLAEIGRPILIALFDSLRNPEINIDAVTDTMENFEPPLEPHELLPTTIELLCAEEQHFRYGGLDIVRKFLSSVESDELDRLLWNSFFRQDLCEVEFAAECLDYRGCYRTDPNQESLVRKDLS